MHTHLLHNPNLTGSVIFGLGWVYLLMFAMNAFWTRRSMAVDGSFRWSLFGLLGKGIELPYAMIWAVYSALLFMVATFHLTSSATPQSFFIYMPDILKEPINRASNPVAFFVGSTALFVAMILFRKWWTSLTAGWILLNLSFLFMALSITDYDFRQIVGKPDNVPIVAMLYIVGFFTWLYFRKSVENDRRKAAGLPLIEQENNEKVLTWPDLVYT
ncbi:MAG: hypothetical protein FJ267_15655, partial [Planctomycetes bacterium]|nr:hypothetical protein [Planctomycetota bacterium]